MKKNLFCLLLLLCTVSFFSSCSDDDKDTPPLVGAEFDGVYKGTLDVVAPSLSIDEKNIPQKVYITKVGDNLFKLQLKNFSFKTFKLGDIEVSDLRVVKNENSCTFSGSDQLSLTVGTCEVTIDGAIIDKKTEIKIDVKVLDGMFKDLEVNVQFKGDKLAADQSSEAQIKSFVVNTKPEATSATIDQEKKEITLILPDTLSNYVLTPTIETSTGATITPESGKEQNFGTTTTTPIMYKVVSEDGITTTEYTVKALKKGAYDYEDWKTKTNDNYPLPIGQYGSTNDGIQMINSIVSQIPDIYPTVSGDTALYCVTPTTDAKSGSKAVKIQTVSLQPQKKSLYDVVDIVGEEEGALFTFIADAAPFNTAGSFFTGKFQTDLENTLRSTKFGTPYAFKPIKFSGWYKYTSGENLRDKNNNIITGQKDECLIYAVLYEAKDENDKEVTLTGADINDSPYVILRASLKDGNKAEWTHFELDFVKENNKDYDPSKAYKLAIICTSSINGDSFIGAPGSTLTIDNFEILAE